ncbi:hypothetical protein NDU88_007563 [Pleurodeles waltl]|uniref:Uncharacterized protein n=1 Tax=Pleurodeles waltl TaxID=8319 RepID=A0AAV7NWB9_PLEWA|nr:hypothetical protein NDU88_007563 [Pleurodeles waltl]
MNITCTSIACPNAADVEALLRGAGSFEGTPQLLQWSSGQGYTASGASTLRMDPPRASPGRPRNERS